MKNSVFFPQTVLDVWMTSQLADLDGEELVLSESGYRYHVVEAVRITEEVTSGEDPRDLCGRVKPREELTEALGAELLGGSMLVEDSAYDVVQGFLGIPVGPVAEGAPLEEQALMALAQREEFAALA